MPTLGFGYPHAGFIRFHFLGSLFQPPTLLSFNPSELFSSRMILRRFPFFRFRSCVLLQNPFELCTDATAAYTHPKSRSPDLQPNFLRWVGDLYSHGLDHLSGFPSEDPLRESPSFAALPSHSSVPNGLTIARTGSLRASLSPARNIPPKRAPACLMFPTDCHPPPLWEVNSPLTIFSSRGPKNSYGSLGSSLRSESIPA